VVIGASAGTGTGSRRSGTEPASEETRHWVSRVIETEWPIRITPPALASVVWFGTIPNVFFALTVLGRRGQLPGEFVVAIAFAILWLNVGPWLIWYYDRRVMPEFFAALPAILERPGRVEELASRYDRLFSTLSVVPIVLWNGLLVALFFRSQSFLAAEGLFEVGGPLYVLYLVSVVWLGTFTGIGFAGVLTTLLAIRAVATERLAIDPMHPDGLAGLSVFGSYAIRTTLTFSSGALLLPLAFLFVRAEGYEGLIYPIVVLYMLAIAFSFVYPTYRINRRAKRIRGEIVDSLRGEYRAATERLESAGGFPDRVAAEGDGRGDERPSASADGRFGSVELVGQLELQRLREEYRNYTDVRLYPFQVGVMLKLVSSVLLPLVFLGLEWYLT